MKPGAELRFREFCRHIAVWGDRIPALIGDRNFEQFQVDQACHLAVWKCVEVLGEASAKILKLDGDFADRYRDLPLKRAYAMRNQLTHGYGSVDLGILWTTATLFVPMVEQAKAVLGEDD